MFLFPSILWIGIPLIGLPVLIHLINMVRQRRVHWAAMDFLLESQRRHKKWIFLKQLLLLLTRMAVIAAIVFMLAQPLLQSDLARLLGGAETHHIVLLDDSFSMSDRSQERSAFEQAKDVVRRLTQQISRQGTEHTFSLLRFSAAANPPSSGPFDMNQETVNGDVALRLENLLGSLQPSESAATAASALEAVRRLDAPKNDENRILYLVSDFRSRDWSEPTELRKMLDQLNRDGAKIHLVHCVESVKTNLAISDLKPHVGTRAAGVEMFMELAVKNFGDETQRNVSVALQEDGHARPGLEIPRIDPGESVTRQFRVNLAQPGQHTITAALPSDPVLVDNQRYVVVDMPERVPVLVIDGAAESRDGYFLAAGLSPGGNAHTGIAPQIEGPQFLRNPDRLSPFQTIYVLNVGHLQSLEIEALEAFAKAGGGVAFFLGELSQSKFINEHLYRDGSGLFPVPLVRSTNLLVDRLEKTPDLELTTHPIFKLLLALRNNPINGVMIKRYFTVPQDWKPDPQSTVQVIAKLRNGAPLIVEKPFGEGRVVAVLTKVSPEETPLGSWNNWARDHSFVPTILSLQGYLASAGATAEARIVGQALALDLDATKYEPKFLLATPKEDTEGTLAIDAVAVDDRLQATIADTTQSGIYIAQLRTADGKSEDRYFAYNVDANEGALQMLNGEQLARRLEGIEYEFHRAEELQYSTEDVAGFNLSQPLLYALIAMLLIEQLLAYSASYHPPKREFAR